MSTEMTQSTSSTGFAEFHGELRAVARQLLSQERGEVGQPVDLTTEDLVASGWLGLEVPDALGGAGATFAEAAVVLQELGRAAASSGLVGSAILGVGALALTEPSAEQRRLLTGIAEGNVSVTVALPAGDEDDEDVPFALEAGAGSGAWRLSGAAPYVLDGPGSGRLFLPARCDDGVVLVDAGPATPGLTITERPVVDPTRRLASVAASSVRVDATSVHRFAADPWSALRRLGQRGALAMACDSLGIAEAMMEATVAYAGVRQQFGRPIGSFQAVQHACADMLVEVSMSRELVVAAADAVAGDEPGAPVAVSMAKSYACGAAVAVAGKAMQLHGGIGYTWESGIHAFFKRAALNRSLFGSPTHHRRKLGQRYLPPAPAGPTP